MWDLSAGWVVPYGCVPSKCQEPLSDAVPHLRTPKCSAAFQRNTAIRNHSPNDVPSHHRGHKYKDSYIFWHVTLCSGKQIHDRLTAITVKTCDFMGNHLLLPVGRYPWVGLNLLLQGIKIFMQACTWNIPLQSFLLSVTCKTEAKG